MPTTPNPRRVCVLLRQSLADWTVLHGVSAYSREHGPWELLVRSAGEEYRWFTQGPPDGMIAVGAHNAEEVSRAVPWPVVHVMPVLPPPAGMPLVSIDDRAIGRLAAEYLVRCGYHRFAYYGTEGVWSVERLTGFQAALSRKHGPLVLNTIGDSAQWPDWGQATVSAYAERFVTRLTPPTAVFACDDILARYVANACLAKGLHIPGQIAILGVDNDLWSCESSDLTLSSIDRDLPRVGYEAASILAQIIAGERREHPAVLVKPRGVVARRSTDPEAFEDQDVAAAVRLIRTSACDGISVASICRSISVSRRALERRFREATGHTPGEEIRRIRMDRARELLATTHLPIADICARCGYEALPSFIAAFRKSAGVTPKVYRLKHTEG